MLPVLAMLDPGYRGDPGSPDEEDQASEVPLSRRDPAHSSLLTAQAGNATPSTGSWEHFHLGRLPVWIRQLSQHLSRANILTTCRMKNRPILTLKNKLIAFDK